MTEFIIKLQDVIYTIFGNFSQQAPILCVYSAFGGLTMAAPMGHLTIKFNSIKFNSLGLLVKYYYRQQDLQLCILVPTKDTGVNTAQHGAQGHIQVPQSQFNP